MVSFTKTRNRERVTVQRRRWIARKRIHLVPMHREERVYKGCDERSPQDSRVGPEEGGDPGLAASDHILCQKYFCGRTLLITVTMYGASNARPEASPAHSVALVSVTLTGGTIAKLGSGACLRQVTNI